MLKSTFSETICESHTYYPGLGDFTLPHTYKYFDWYYPKCELHSKKWVVDNVDSNWNILDVGANVGVYSILFAKLASEGQVFALEPTTTIRLLEKNLKHHKLNNVSIYNIGLSDKSARVEENIFKIWGKPSESSVYEMKRLDEFVNSLNLKRLDLIKIGNPSFSSSYFREI
jgi:FkbM family methyltransferase